MKKLLIFDTYHIIEKVCRVTLTSSLVQRTRWWAPGFAIMRTGARVDMTDRCIEKWECLLWNSGQKREKCPHLLKLKPVWLVQLIRGNANVCERQCDHQDAWYYGHQEEQVLNNVEQLTKQVLGITQFQTLEKQLCVTSWAVSINCIFQQTKRTSCQRREENTQ